MLIVWLYFGAAFGFWLAFMIFDDETEKGDFKLHLVVFFFWWLVAYIVGTESEGGPHD